MFICFFSRPIAMTTGLPSLDGGDFNPRLDTRKRPLVGVLLWDKQHSITFLYFLNITMELGTFKVQALSEIPKINVKVDPKGFAVLKQRHQIHINTELQRSDPTDVSVLTSEFLETVILLMVMSES
jgi:hypothetical protein